MPISSNTISDLKKTTAQFDFLLTTPNIKLKALPASDRLCVICQEPFDNNTVWKHGATLNRPVKLDCGHHFGIQCLTHLVFTPDFNNRCPLCRAPIMPASFLRNPSGQSWKAAVPLLRLLMMFGGDRTTFAKENALDVLQNGLEKEGLTSAPAAGKHMHRIMVLYEEFLNQFCDQDQPPADAERLAVSEARLQELRDLMRERQELERAVEESRGMLARAQELARSQAEEEVRVVREELRGVETLLREAREEVRVVRQGLDEFEAKVQVAEDRREKSERELKGVKKELREVRGKAREELEGVQKELNEVLEKAGKELEGAEEESKGDTEKALKDCRETVQSLKAKVALAWFCFRLSLIGVVFTLLWVYF